MRLVELPDPATREMDQVGTTWKKWRIPLGMLPLNNFVDEPVNWDIFRSTDELAHQLRNLAYGCIYKGLFANEVHIQYGCSALCRQLRGEDQNARVRNRKCVCIA